MNNETFLVEENELDLAKDICKLIDNTEVRNRAVANVLAANIAKKYFQEFNVDIESGIHNIASVLNEYEISDIYVKDSYIDVRLYFDENEMFIPCSHFEMGVLPVAYMFIKLDEELSSGVVSGFLLPSGVSREDAISGYYKINESDLISFYDVEPLLGSSYDDGLSEGFEKSVFDYLDGKLQDKCSFYNELIRSKDARQVLYNASKAKDIFNFVSISKDFSSKEYRAETSLDSNDTLTFENLGDEGSIEPLNIEDVDTLEVQEEAVDLDEVLIDDSLSLESETEESPLEEFDFETELLNEDLTDEYTEEVSIDNSDALETIFPESSIGQVDGFKFDDVMLEQVGQEELPLAEKLEYKTIDSESAPDSDYIQIDSTDVENNDDSDLEISLVDDNFSTNITPSINSIIEEESVEEAVQPSISDIVEDTADVPSEPSNVNIDLVDDSSDEEKNDTNVAEEDVLESETTDQEISDSNAEENSSIDENSLEELFANSSSNTEEASENHVVRKKNSSIVTTLGLLTLLAVGGYFGYTKFFTGESVSEPVNNISKNTVKETIKEEAMPIETIEEPAPVSQINEEPAPAIKSIERSIGSSVKVSNMSINWNIPLSYESSNTARRYLTKIGEILQLQIKTELLLLTQGPINNKVAVELVFNKDLNKFDVKGVTTSSGDSAIDNVITSTVKKVLDMNLNGNLSTLASMQGNPVLVINF